MVFLFLSRITSCVLHFIAEDVKEEGQEMTAVVKVKYFHFLIPGLLVEDDVSLHMGQFLPYQISTDMEMRGESSQERKGDQQWFYTLWYKYKLV